MKIHLSSFKGHTNRLACTKKNQFIRGRVLDLNEFLKAHEDGKDCCQKCLSIAANQKEA